MNCFLNTTPYYGMMVGTSCTANSAGAAEGGCCREVAREVAGELEGMSRGCRGYRGLEWFAGGCMEWGYINNKQTFSFLYLTADQRFQMRCLIFRPATLKSITD